MPNLIEHKKATFNFELLEQYEAGIQLFGYEVKTLRDHHGTLDGAHITVRGGEAFLINADIPPYQPANAPDAYDPHRNRRLLLTKKELAALGKFEEQKGLTIIPISMYNKGRVIKVRIAVARGKKKADKRQTLMKREHLRDVARAVKSEVQRIGKRLHPD